MLPAGPRLLGTAHLRSPPLPGVLAAPPPGARAAPQAAANDRFDLPSLSRTLPGRLRQAGCGTASAEVADRFMLVGFLLGSVHDRRLMREPQVNLAIRWFCGYGLHEMLPDHSSLTRIRQRWGAEHFAGSSCLRCAPVCRRRLRRQRSFISTLP
jgi:hypothetical protein